MLISLNKYNIRYYSKQLDYFFANNIDDWYYFHPHKYNGKEVENIILNSKRDFYGIYVEKENIIGYGMLRGIDEGYDIPSLGIIVDRNYRRKGYSKKIMNSLHSQAHLIGAKKVRLTVLKENYIAINLYKKLGYEFSELDEKKLIGFKTL